MAGPVSAHTFAEPPLPFSLINLSYNHFVCGIPPEFGGIPVAVSLDLRGNDLAGVIPQVGSLVNQAHRLRRQPEALRVSAQEIECAGEREESRRRTVE